MTVYLHPLTPYRCRRCPGVVHPSLRAPPSLRTYVCVFPSVPGFSPFFVTSGHDWLWMLSRSKDRAEWKNCDRATNVDVIPIPDQLSEQTETVTSSPSCERRQTSPSCARQFTSNCPRIPLDICVMCALWGSSLLVPVRSSLSPASRYVGLRSDSRKLLSSYRSFLSRTGCTPADEE